MSADLQRYYGVSLSDVEAGRHDLLDVAAWVANYPRGGAIAEWIGGWGAVTAEEETLRRIEHLLNVQIVQASGRKRKVPEPKPPESVRVQAERKRKTQVRLDRVRSAVAGGWR